MACASPGYVSYFSSSMKRFEKTKPENVKFYRRIPKEQFVRIGYVYSSPSQIENDPEQLQKMKKLAASMGAHGLIDLELNQSSEKSYAPDPKAPIPSFESSTKKVWVRRATAIRFIQQGNAQ